MDISPAEWRVMRVVWTLGQATSTQVTEALAQRADWKPGYVRIIGVNSK
ncbi:BlaI/MecI/CopY family transcriptional regulator [Limosilactobacillus fermentum]|nr:BlaI/MecI/CopY family transcriptional regulator [Limosilactobacillus fermentum]